MSVGFIVVVSLMNNCLETLLNGLEHIHKENASSCSLWTQFLKIASIFLYFIRYHLSCFFCSYQNDLKSVSTRFSFTKKENVPFQKGTGKLKPKFFFIQILESISHPHIIIYFYLLTKKRYANYSIIRYK